MFRNFGHNFDTSNEASTLSRIARHSVTNTLSQTASTISAFTPRHISQLHLSDTLKILSTFEICLWQYGWGFHIGLCLYVTCLRLQALHFSKHLNKSLKVFKCYLLTYSMVQSPSREANWFAASQKIPHISRNPKVHYRTHKRPPPVSILGRPIPVHIPTSHLLEIRPNIIHPSTPRSLQWSLSLRFPTKTLYTPSPHPYAPHVLPISFFSILSPAQYWVRSTNHLTPRYAISSIPPLPRPS